MQYQNLLGAIGVGIALISYIPYLKDIFEKRTKPHIFTWFIWTVLTAIAFFGQLVDNGGPGAWVTGVTSVLGIVVCFAALKRGHKEIVALDWWSLIGAGIALALWYLTKGPLLSVILVTIIDNIAFIPTLRKSIAHPEEETVSTYFLSGLKFVFSIPALRHWSVVTLLYPVSLLVTCWFFVALLLIRRRQLGR